MERTDFKDPKYLMSDDDLGWVTVWRVIQCTGVVAAMTGVLWGASVSVWPMLDGLDGWWVSHGYALGLIGVSVAAGWGVSAILGIPVRRRLEARQLPAGEDTGQTTETAL